MSDDLARLESAFAAVPIPLVETELTNGTISRANRAADEFFGLPVGGMVGRRSSEFYASPNDRQRLLDALQTEGEVRNLRLELHAGDGIRTVLLSARVIEGSVPPRMIASAFDITDQIEREHQLKLAEAEYRALFDNAVIGIYRSSVDGRMLRANQALARLNGYSSEAELIQAVNDIASEWYVDPNRRAEWQRLMRLNGRVTDFESEIYRHKTRERIWISENSWTVFGDDGEPRYYEGNVIEATNRKRAEAQIEHMAKFDALTELPNRRLFSQRMEAALEQLRMEGRPFAVMCLDLDRFKPVNDAFGHEAGDRLLRQVADRLRPLCRPQDTLARVGGDEFALIYGNARTRHEIDALARLILAAFEQPFDLDGPQALLGVSIGIATAPADGGVAASLLRKADLALYAAKAGGRNGFRYFDGATTKQSAEIKRLG